MTSKPPLKSLISDLSPSNPSLFKPCLLSPGQNDYYCAVQKQRSLRTDSVDKINLMLNIVKMFSVSLVLMFWKEEALALLKIVGRSIGQHWTVKAQFIYSYVRNITNSDGSWNKKLFICENSFQKLQNEELGTYLYNFASVKYNNRYFKYL